MARHLDVRPGGHVFAGRGSVCAGCGAPIEWRLTKLRKWQPVDPDGTSHFATCPKAAAFRRVERRRAVRDVGRRLL